MANNVITIDGNDTILEACKKYNDYKIGCMIVTNEGSMMGIITERDIISRAIIKKRSAGNKN